MAAWRTVATSKGGGCPCCQVSLRRQWLIFAYTQYKQQSFYTVHIVPPLEVVDPGGGRSMLLSLCLSGRMLAESFLAGGTATAAYSCEQTMAALHLQLGWVVAAFAPCWILNFVIHIHNII
jgi:hypothetical protein